MEYFLFLEAAHKLNPPAGYALLISFFPFFPFLFLPHEEARNRTLPYLQFPVAGKNRAVVTSGANDQTTALSYGRGRNLTMSYTFIYNYIS